MKCLKRTGIVSALLILCSTVNAQIENQIIQAQPNANYWISGLGKTNNGLVVAKDGADVVLTGIRMTNLAETRGANFQLTNGPLPGLAAWIHDGTNWVERMRIAPNGFIGFGMTPTRKFQILDTSTSVYTQTGTAAAPPGVIFEGINSSPVDGSSSLILMTATNSISAKNVAYIGAVANKDIWTPDVVIGQRTNGNNWTERMRIAGSSGNVGIGTAPVSAYKLAVNGVIGTRRLIVTQATWADFVFDRNYVLPTLEEVEAYVRVNGHLKDVPSAQEVAKEGVDVGEMNKILLQKIEELTLHLIELNKENKIIKERLNTLEGEKNK